MDSEEFEPDALVDSGVAHRHDAISALWIQHWARQFRSEDGVGRGT